MVTLEFKCRIILIKVCHSLHIDTSPLLSVYSTSFQKSCH